MKCVRCGSLRMVRFLDGFGERRIFCRKCWGSYPELNFVKLSEQKNLQDFKLNINYGSRLGGR